MVMIYRARGEVHLNNSIVLETIRRAWATFSECFWQKECEVPSPLLKLGARVLKSTFDRQNQEAEHQTLLEDPATSFWSI